MLSAVEVVRYLASGKGVFDSICDLIIRPPRAKYEPKSDLGPEVFRMDEEDMRRYRRTDFTLQNMRCMELQCSWFRSVQQRRQPCVVYLHGNCGSRYDGLEALFLLSHGFSLFTFDATGSGMSDGEYISLGFYERQDLAAVVEYLSAQKDVDAIGFWGRSMGAVTSIMYASKDPSIKCIVCDSPFSTLRLVIKDLVRRHWSRRVPSGFVDRIVDRIRKRIAKRAAFDIDDLNSLRYASECVVPTFIFHGRGDEFVLPKHSIEVHDAFKGSCLHHMVDGGHNDERDESVRNTIVHFFTLYLIQKPEGDRIRKSQQEHQKKETEERIKQQQQLRPIATAGHEEGLSSSFNDFDVSSIPTGATLMPISFKKPRLCDATSSLSTGFENDSVKGEEDNTQR